MSAHVCSEHENGAGVCTICGSCECGEDFRRCKCKTSDPLNAERSGQESEVERIKREEGIDTSDISETKDWTGAERGKFYRKPTERSGSSPDVRDSRIANAGSSPEGQALDEVQKRHTRDKCDKAQCDFCDLLTLTASLRTRLEQAERERDVYWKPKLRMAEQLRDKYRAVIEERNTKDTITVSRKRWREKTHWAHRGHMAVEQQIPRILSVLRFKNQKHAAFFRKLKEELGARGVEWRHGFPLIKIIRELIQRTEAAEARAERAEAELGEVVPRMNEAESKVYELVNNLERAEARVKELEGR